MRLFTISLVCFSLLTIGGCSSSGSSDGASATAKFRSRTGVSLPADFTNAKFAWYHIRDSYSEYYRFDCSKENSDFLQSELELSDTTWGSPSPNAPDWWVNPKGSVPSKSKFSDVAYGSRMSSWYDQTAGAVFVKVSFSD